MFSLLSVTTKANASRPGGSGSAVYDRARPALIPMANLSAQDKTQFYAGKALATQPWVKAPTITTARDGLGPLYNARTCLSCHVRGLRGSQPEASGEAMTALVKLSLPGVDPIKGSIVDPVYGDQIQTRSTDFFTKFKSSNNKRPTIPAEASVTLEWIVEPFKYPDGHRVDLRKPRLKIDSWGYGEPNKKLIYSLRNAPNLFGMGLLEQIPEADILAQSDPEDLDKNGISGRVNKVWDFAKQRSQLGRFGWKANRSTVKQITAAAFVHDIGITSDLFNAENCSKTQSACKELAQRDHPEVEISERLLDLSANFVEHIAVPMTSQLSQAAEQGQALFTDLGCNLCHRASYITQKNEAKAYLSQQTIYPYTDLLLHDLGVGLADGRQEYSASGVEWRTAPLWGLSAEVDVKNGAGYLLHDGRARSVEEAILWHGGEAQTIKDSFVGLPRSERDKLIEFVLSL